VISYDRAQVRGCADLLAQCLSAGCYVLVGRTFTGAGAHLSGPALSNLSAHVGAVQGVQARVGVDLIAPDPASPSLTGHHPAEPDDDNSEAAKGPPI
jgi:hypothetical protein